MSCSIRAGNILAECTSPPLPWPSRGRAGTLAGRGGDVSFLRKQESSTPLPRRERPAVPMAPPGEGGHSVIPTQPGIQKRSNWIPTFAGMTYKGDLRGIRHLDSWLSGSTISSLHSAKILPVQNIWHCGFI